jgi:hypothetical protein
MTFVETLAEIREAERLARERLAGMACYAAPVPTSIDVLAELRAKGVVGMSRRMVLDGCEFMRLRLADSDRAGHDGETLRLQVVEVDASGSD